MYYFVSLFPGVGTTAVDCVKRLDSEMTCYMSSGVLRFQRKLVIQCCVRLQADGDPSGKVRDRFQLDSCLIRVDPQLAVEFEHIRHPQNLIAQLGLDVDFNEDGLVIAGTAKCRSSPSRLGGR